MTPTMLRRERAARRRTRASNNTASKHIITSLAVYGQGPALRKAPTQVAKERADKLEVQDDAEV